MLEQRACTGLAQQRKRADADQAGQGTGQAQPPPAQRALTLEPRVVFRSWGRSPSAVIVAPFREEFREPKPAGASVEESPTVVHPLHRALAWQRNGARADARAFGRQIGAVLQSGDRTAALRGVRVPTLVVHGDVDRMVHPSGGAATAAAIPGARHVVLPGMRHQIDTLQSARLAPLLVGHFQEAERDAA